MLCYFVQGHLPVLCFMYTSQTTPKNTTNDTISITFPPFVKNSIYGSKIGLDPKV